jgi:diguanylate cyclase (GGDEF)-like protein
MMAFGHISGHLQLPAPAAQIATSTNQWAVHFMASAFFFASLLMMVTYYQRSTDDLVREISQQRDEITRLANFDSLTGLPVSRLANDRLDVACRHAERDGGKVALLFIDLDGFKAVNDAAGHEAGDHCLRVIAGRLNETVRVEDTVSRVGGDEFVVIIARIRDRQDIAQLATKLVAAVGVPIEWHDQTFTLGASIGIALFPNDGDDRETLMRRADQAMYAVKRSGKNTYGFAGDV